jgi:hypothetical protein
MVDVSKVLELVNSDDPANKLVGLGMIAHLYEEMVKMDLVAGRSYKVHWCWYVGNKLQVGYSLSLFVKWDCDKKIPVFDITHTIGYEVLTIEEI